MAFTVFWKDGAVQYHTQQEYQLDWMRKRYLKANPETAPELLSQSPEPFSNKRKVKKRGRFK